ncbi:hypothetical protein CIPAW_15G005100 [Carya illinoinensis]|uniref:Uncharacterized protein n=1 Tax=Carya illinoinensis TaxID=32201 RepID=A0A8T1N7H9_CARIL|nr:hypothetical protein CIPAW_15G005100 [Carya illinoinensis]KAG6673707.1 hypothetical protein I3842_15G004800 [Carya illinoinensis]
MMIIIMKITQHRKGARNKIMIWTIHLSKISWATYVNKGRQQYAIQ